MRHYILFTCLVLKACATPEPSRRPAAEERLVSVDPAMEADVRLLKTHLKSRLITLDRDLLTFHYESFEETGVRPMTRSSAVEHTASGVETYFDLATEKGLSYEAGPGKYVAMDAYATRPEYGRATPQLYVIPIKAGARVLNETIPFASVAERATLLRLFQTYQCQEPWTTTPDEFFEVIGYLRGAKSEACKRLVIRAFQDLGVDAVMYGYPGGASTLEGCPYPRAVAVSIIRNQAIRWERFGYYDQDRAFSSGEDRAFIKRLYDEAARDPQFINRGQWTFDIASLDGATASNGAYARWKAESIFGCGAPSILTDANESGPTLARLVNRYRDPEVLAAQIALARAIGWKVPTQEIRFSNLRGFERLASTADSSDSVAPERWRAATETMMKADDPGAGLGAAARTLGEAPPRVPARNAMRTIFAASVEANGKVSLTHGLKSLGFGPLLARLETIDLMLFMGGVPPVRREMGDSKRAVLQLFRRCESIYRDPARSPESIADTACGFRATAD